MRFIVSNTTEAGIAYNPEDKYDDCPPSSYPGKLTRFLHERYKEFNGASDSGFILIPCELMDYNGEALRAIVLKICGLWNLGRISSPGSKRSNTFCSTLVDRIVTGYPRMSGRADERAGIQGQLHHNRGVFSSVRHSGSRFCREELHLEGSGLNIKLVET